MTYKIEESGAKAQESVGGLSWNRIPEEGLPLELIDERLSKLIESNRYQISTGRPCAHPVTRVHSAASYAQHRVESTINANMVSPYMHDAVWDAVEETESMLLHLIGHLETERCGSIVLKSATQALSQALQSFIDILFFKKRVYPLNHYKYGKENKKYCEN